MLQPGLKGICPFFSSHAYPLPPRAEKMSKKINKNDKIFEFQNPLTCMYLMQPYIGETLKLCILTFVFAKKKVMPN
jgi:hypothetical protein